jgi:hypothetical protein
MQCFVCLVNSSFSAVCTRLISLFGALQKQDANYSKAAHSLQRLSVCYLCRFYHTAGTSMRLPSIAATDHPELAGQLDQAINNKTKPLGSLGALEGLAKQLGLIQQTLKVTVDRPAILVFAGDHGVVAEGISAFPQDVTWQMVENFLANGAAINVFARQNGAALHIVDAGVNHDFGPRPGLIDRKVAHGTRNFAHEPAMTAEQCAPRWRTAPPWWRTCRATWSASARWASGTRRRPPR